MMLTALANVARAADLRVVESSGWKDRGHGGMKGVRTITCHHTANGGASGNYPSLRVVRDGRPGLSGPLSHLGLGLDGTVYVIAAGLCYHAGVSRALAYTNSYAIGIEAEARGTGWSGDWPPAQMRAYRRLCKALCKHYSLSVADIRGHKETCSPAGRKSDPTFSMAAFRTSVSKVNLSDPLEDDMAFPSTNTEAQKWFDLFWRGKMPGQDALLGGDALTPAQQVDMARRLATEVRTDVDGLVTTAEALRSSIASLAEAVQALTDQVGHLSNAPE